MGARAASPIDDDLVVTAAGHDGFCGSDLGPGAAAPAAIELLVLVGMAAEVAVSCTVRSANDRGYECLTLVRRRAPLDPDTGRHELHSVTMSGGIFGAVGTSDAFIRADRRRTRPVRPWHRSRPHHAPPPLPHDHT